jgi:thiol-disulfide isomerase/thioredoxin
MVRSNTLSKDSGPTLSSKIPLEYLKEFELNSVLELARGKSTNLLAIFVSVFCTHCVDLLPSLKELSNEHQILLITNGSSEDNRDMIEYFEWTFPVLSLTNDEVNEYFNVSYFPFVVVYKDELVILKSVVYSLADIETLLKR